VSADQYTVVASKPVYRGRVVSMRIDELRMSDGTVASREIVEHPGAVAIVAIDDDDVAVASDAPNARALGREHVDGVGRVPGENT